MSARPDYITISMTIESIRKDYDEAMRDASERISKLQDVAVRSGYAKEDLKTTSFNVDKMCIRDSLHPVLQSPVCVITWMTMIPCL